MLVFGLLAAAFLLVPTGLGAQENHCTHENRENCLLGSFSEIVQAKGITFRALLTVSPGGGAVETNTAQGAPVTVHGSWEATKDDHFAFTFITFALSGPFTGRTRETVNLSDSGDSFTATLQTDLMDAKGNVVLTIVGTATGERILVVPLN
jgi:hypothetical protein